MFSIACKKILAFFFRFLRRKEEISSLVYLRGGSGGLLKWLKRPVLKTGRWMEYSTREFKSLILRHNMGQDGNDLKCAPLCLFFISWRSGMNLIESRI